MAAVLTVFNKPITGVRAGYLPSLFCFNLRFSKLSELVLNEAGL
jgi:hypothetical protein